MTHLEYPSLADVDTIPWPIQNMIPIVPRVSGLDIVVSRHLPFWHQKQYRFPRTKNRRIRKKWSRRAGNWHQVPREVFRMGNRLVVSPGFMKKLTDQMNRQIDNLVLSSQPGIGGIFSIREEWRVK